MTVLDNLPDVGSCGINLETMSFIIAALGIVHPMAYGCTFFMPMSYLLVTIWILVALYCFASVLLFYGVFKGQAIICVIWMWYAAIFVAVMMLLMILLAVVFVLRQHTRRLFIIVLAMLWYILTIYFILVINSYRKELATKNTLSEQAMFKNSLSPESMALINSNPAVFK